MKRPSKETLRAKLEKQRLAPPPVEVKPSRIIRSALESYLSDEIYYYE